MNRLPERLIGGHVGAVEGCRVELHEPLALLFGNSETAVNRDEMVESELSREPIRPAEGLRSERGQVVDVLGFTSAEEGLKYGIGEDACVENILEAVQCFLTAGVLIKRGH